MQRGTLHLFVAAVAWSAVHLLAPAPAAAQACCTATGAGEFAVVGRCQDKVLGAQMSYQRGLGSYADDGEYRSLDHAEVNDVTLSVGGGFRVIDKSFQLYGSAPLRLQQRGLDGTGTNTSVGLGDVGLAARWTALADNMAGLDFGEADSLVPFLDLYAGTKLPTGRPAEDSEVTTGSDIMGDGSWQLYAGAKAAKFIAPEHVFGLRGQYSYAFARTIDHGGTSTEYRPGPTWLGALSYLYIHDLFWSGGLVATYEWSARAESGGALVPDSESRRLSFGGHITHGFDFPFWEATLSVTVDSWWERGGENVPFVGPSASVALRRQWL